MDQDATWVWAMEVSLGPGHIVLDGDPAPPQRDTSPICGPCLLWPNGWMDQDTTWQGWRPQPSRHCVRWGPSSPSKGGTASPSFWPIYCGQTAGWIKMPFGREVGLDPARQHCVRWGPSPPPQKGTAPQFSAHMLWPNGCRIKMPLGTDRGRPRLGDIGHK